MTAAASAVAPGPAAYDHSRQKGKAPGTRGPLPKEFSRTELSVKFFSDRVVRVRAHKPVARNDAEASAIERTLARYPGASMRPLVPLPENRLAAEREKLEKRTGRRLPDMNSWFTITVPQGIEKLLDDLNALPSVEIAQAKLEPVKPSEPLRPHQRYRNAVGAAGGTGIDADAVNALPGGKGDGITISDVEAASGLRVGSTPGAIAAGDSHTLTMVSPSSDGGYDVLWATGRNDKGQLGGGDNTDSDVLMPVESLRGFKAVAAAGDFSVVVKKDGTVWAWGDNSEGQLGNGTTNGSNKPVQVPGVTNAVNVSAGSDGHVLVALSDGTVKAWGNNTDGQLGDGTTTSRRSPVTVTGLSGVSTAYGAIAAGGGHSLALLSDGTVKAWGKNSNGQLGDGGDTSRSTPITVPGLAGVQQVAAGGAHSLARVSGTVRSWGANDRGQLGDGSTEDRPSPVSVSELTGTSEIAAGAAHSASISANAVRTWGSNRNAQLGDDNMQDSPVPVHTAPNGNCSDAAVATGARHTLIYEHCGSPYGWGANTNGQLGTGDRASSAVPVRTLTTINEWNTCHEELAGRPAPAGPPIRLSRTIAATCVDGLGYHGTAVAGILGANDENGAGIAGIAPRAKLLLGATRDGGLAAARQRSTAGDVILIEAAYRFADGKWYPLEWAGWHYDEIVLATAAGITVVEPAGNGANDLDDAADGRAADIMRRPDSGAIMVGAGEPPSEAGANCSGSSRPPARTAIHKDPETFWGTTFGSRVDVQGYGDCVATLGTFPNGNDLSPTETDQNKLYYSWFNGTSSASPIVAGGVAALQGLVKRAGGAPLPPGTIRRLLKQTGTPQPAGDTRHIGPLPNLKAAVNYVRGGIAGGERFTIGIKNDGTVWSWGHNEFGQLGTGSTSDSNVPRQVPGLTGVARRPGAVAASTEHALAVRSDGTVWAWGRNNLGQLGDGTTTGRPSPVQVTGLSGVIAVAAGSQFSLALKSDGTVWGWGANQSGQIGDGTRTTRLTPVQAVNLTGVAAIAARASHAMATRTDGTVWTWGNTVIGGSNAGTLTPAQVSGLTNVAVWPGSIAAGTHHFLVVRTDGTVWAWGENSRGQLGDGGTTGRTAPAQVPGLSGVSTVGPGAWSSFAVKHDGTVSAWGYNGAGELGLGTSGGFLTSPATVTSLNGVMAVTGGGYHSVAVRADGSMLAWGSNYRGQLGTGTNTDSTSPAQVTGMP
ncbi:S8 family serine peptidase [Actinomadura fulvescens]|uniref:RCC1 domain-containing protein n=1 Tax=Actinomadura fulvescens TaxID=46160 RepID=UPI00397DFFED